MVGHRRRADGAEDSSWLNDAGIIYPYYVPARLGKGLQGAKEMGHNLVWGITKIWAQFKARMTKPGTLLRMNDQNSVTIQHANETRSRHNSVGDR